MASNKLKLSAKYLLLLYGIFSATKLYTAFQIFHVIYSDELLLLVFITT